MTNDIYCVKDQSFYIKERSGVEIKRPNIGTRRGDLYRCPTCGNEVLGDFGKWRQTFRD